MSFLKSTFTVSFFTLLSRLFGYVRDVFFARYLGSGFFADVFLTAFRLPNFFRNIFAEGAFNAAFTPLFSNALVTKNKEELTSFTNNIFSMLLYFLLAFTLAAELCMPQLVRLIAPGFVDDVEKYSLSLELCRITFPYLLFISLVSFMGGMLNSLNKFAAVAGTPIILNTTFIVFVLVANYFQWSIVHWLSYAVLVAGILQFLWLFYFICKNNLRIRPRVPDFKDKISKVFIKNFGSGLLGASILQINSMIDVAMATFIGSASSYIYYADRIIQLPLALIGTAVSISILPLLSKKIALEQKEESGELEELSLFTVLFLGVPAAIGIFSVADLLVPIFFEGGRFTADDSMAVASLLKIYAFALPVFMSIKILQTIFYANKDTKTPMYMSLVSLVLNVSLNLLLIRFFNYKGIVMATVIASFVNIALLIAILVKQKRLSFSGEFYFKLIKLLYINLIMFLALVILKALLAPIGFRKLGCLVKLCILVAGAAASYFGAAILSATIDRDFIRRLLRNS